MKKKTKKEEKQRKLLENEIVNKKEASYKSDQTKLKIKLNYIKIKLKIAKVKGSLKASHEIIEDANNKLQEAQIFLYC